MRYASNEVALPDRDEPRGQDDPEVLPTLRLLGDDRREAQAQLHWRITPPLLALAFALLALPLSRSTPRQQRYGSVMLAFLGYVVGISLMISGRQWLASGKLPVELGMWWLTVPLLVLALWLYFRDGRLSRRKRARA
jgi:lipopolysaccharide export system permease protein